MRIRLLILLASGAMLVGIANYDGLYAGFGGGKRRVYRDPSLLITGQTELPFLVG